MSRPKITLVLGAGASRPYNFPTASELRSLILGEVPRGFEFLNNVLYPVDGTHVVWNSLLMRTRPPGVSEESVKTFRMAVRATDLYSIDKFSHYQPEYGEIARHYIALTLLYCENILPVRGEWYAQLWNNFIIGNYEDGGPVLNVITFNYDRSFEYYLGTVVRATFRDQAEKVLDTISIHHVYGDLERKDVVDYGDFKKYSEAAASIRLIPPRLESNDTIIEILEASDRIVFLGFGFDRLNVQVLGIERFRDKEFHATRKGLATSLRQHANSLVGGIQWAGEEDTVADFIHKTAVFD